MAWAFTYTRFYGCSPLLAVASDRLLYTLMTLDSALRHWAREEALGDGFILNLEFTWASASQGYPSGHPAVNRF